MYAYTEKGSRVGYALTRRLLRNITGFPGFLIDAILIAPFWMPDYSNFWNEVSIPNADETRTAGFFRGILGWVGDISGAIIGAVIGAAIGFCLYVPDMIYRGIHWAVESIYEALDDLAKSIGRYSLFNKIAFKNPDNFFEKAWNISISTIGLVFGGILCAPIRFIEYFYPMGHLLSELVLKAGMIVTAALATSVSVIVYPIAKSITNFFNFCDVLRNKFVDAIALVYAKTNVTIMNEDIQKNDDCCNLMPEAMHSAQFLKKVDTYKQNSMMSIFYGSAKELETTDNKHVTQPTIQATQQTVTVPVASTQTLRR